MTSTAVVAGNVAASESATVAGTVQGSLVLTGSAIVTSTAVISGAVQAETPSNVDAGATVTGGTTQLVSWLVDGSSSHRLITKNGTVTQADEGYGVLAALFEGTGQLAGNGVNINSTGNFTIEFFVKPNTVSGTNSIFYAAGSLHLAWENGFMWISDTGSNAFNSNISIETDVWSYWTFSFSSNSLTIYKNGINSGTYVFTLSNTNQFVIGGITSSNLNGKIADPCFICPDGQYCDGIFSYLITPTNDITFTPEREIMTGTVNMYQVFNSHNSINDNNIYSI
jgi:hypothetical protein